jgi:C_GCAxxG_C_C family probable redox protein
LGKYSKRAMDLFKEGYNCSQSVFSAFSEETGIDFETSLKLSSSFGGGMGKLREVCGAVSGMFMVAGIKYGYTNPVDIEAKAEHYKLIQLLAQYFKDENSSIICRELLGLDTEINGYIPEVRTEEYYITRPCAELVGFAAEIMEDFISREK